MFLNRDDMRWIVLIRQQALTENEQSRWRSLVQWAGRKRVDMSDQDFVK